MNKVRRNAAVFFAVQAIATAAWWAALGFFAPVREWFRLGDDDTVLLAFLLPDAVCFFAATATTAILCATRNRLAPYAAWMTVGAVSYATLFCLAFSLRTETGWPGVVCMFPAMIASGNFAIGITPEVATRMFRVSTDSGTPRLLSKTLLQLIVVWTTTLFVIPSFITPVERKIGIAAIEFAGQKPIAVVAFVAVSLIGVSGAVAMVRSGRGTPLPMDTAGRLVVSGPYAFLRNPMAVSGISQGLAVALYLGSPLVALYSLTGGAIWQWIFRPLEEEDLAARFGEPYLDYCRSVRCWLPRFNRYQPKCSSFRA